MAASGIYLSILLTTLLLFVSCENAQNKCYACSYIFSGHDGSTGYACVNDTTNFPQTSKVACAAPNLCTIKAVYERNYTRLLSMDRNCLPKTQSDCTADNPARPTCFSQCSTNLCNDKDGDLSKQCELRGNCNPSSAPYVTSGILTVLLMGLMLFY